MPKTKKITPKTKTETDDQIRIRLLKTEVHYFKGLAIMITVLIVCVFVAFGVLFSAMYLETRMTRLVIEAAFKDFVPAAVQPVDNSAAVAEDEPACCATDEDMAAEVTEADTATWLSFGKYGVTAYFPNSWTYLDKPFQKQIHFYADGVVREDNSSDIGEIAIIIGKKDNYATGEYEKRLVSVAGKIGIEYDLSDKNAVVFSAGKDYFEIKFSPFISDDIKQGFIDKIQLTEK